jgi:hypothetical protein
VQTLHGVDAGGLLQCHQLAAQGREAMVQQLQHSMHLCWEVVAVHGCWPAVICRCRCSGTVGRRLCVLLLLLLLLLQPRAHHAVLRNERVLQQARQLQLWQALARPMQPKRQLRRRCLRRGAGLLRGSLLLLLWRRLALCCCLAALLPLLCGQLLLVVLPL